LESDQGASGFGKSTGRRVKYTVRLRRETEIQTHLEALKMGFRRTGRELPCEGDDRKSGGMGAVFYQWVLQMQRALVFIAKVGDAC
jgi:hypothetical protein